MPTNNPAETPPIAAFLDYVNQIHRWYQLRPEDRDDDRKRWLNNFADFSPSIELYELRRTARQLRFLNAGYTQCLEQEPTKFPPDPPLRAATERLETAAQAPGAAQPSSGIPARNPAHWQNQPLQLRPTP